MKREKAVRKAIPMCIGITAPTGQGKTYSALLMAAGLANGGKVGFIDTEHGRGSMYADDAEIMKAMPQGYDVVELTEPYTPERYVEAMRLLSDCAAIVVDSATHEWEGPGGCCDVAENNKLGGLPNWAKAKMPHKRFMTVVTQSSSYLIFCLRAREKTKPGKDDKGRTVMIECGMQPIQEKNFMFEMTISMLLDENYRPVITKCPRPLQHLFIGGLPITKEVGEKLRAWAESGEGVDKMLRQLKQQCREAAMFGNASLDQFFKELSLENKRIITQGTDKDFQIEVRSIAEDADRITQETTENNTQEEDSLFSNIDSAKTKADEIITALKSSKNEEDIEEIITKNADHIDIMPDEFKALVNIAYTTAKTGISE